MSSVNSNEIPDDILTGILIRLPLKSILRCKSVSRQWRSLISGPQFCRCLYPDPYLVSGLLLHKNSLINKKYDFVSLSDKPTSPPFKRTGSLSGLTVHKNSDIHLTQNKILFL
ncbi:hypothetical protein LWI29_026772 [Acer saccharum]|uniref:F-box domain-containing protein n=1 Tax=Acer saccharum TaxID=4024 RepID=A0AA39VSL4_ACESA|nr:hypothetical protein LWI29_026772 [Acer saccharum]